MTQRKVSKIYCAVRTDGKIFLAGTCKEKLRGAILRSIPRGILNLNDLSNVAIVEHKNHGGHTETKSHTQGFRFTAEHEKRISKAFWSVVRGHDCLDDVGTFCDHLGVHVVNS